MAQPEKAIQAAGVRLLQQLCGRDAVLVFGTHRRRGDHQGTMQTAGVPDVKAFLPVKGTERRVGLWWEVKAPGGRLSPAQRVIANHCVWAGEAHVVGDLDTLIRWLVAEGFCSAGSVAHDHVGP